MDIPNIRRTTLGPFVCGGRTAVGIPAHNEKPDRRYRPPLVTSAAADRLFVQFVPSAPVGRPKTRGPVTRPPHATRRCGSSDVDTVVAGDPGQAGGVALADGAELPFGTVAVQLTEHHGGFGGGILGEVVAGQLFVVGLVHD